MSDEPTIIILTGKAMYAKLVYPDTKYEPRWTVDLLLKGEDLEMAKKNEARVKHNPKYEGLFDGFDGHYVNIAKPCSKADGEEHDPPEVVDKFTNPVPSDDQVGNGSDIRVRALVKDKISDDIKKKYNGYGLFMTKVQVLNMIPYERMGDPSKDFVVEEEGTYTASFPHATTVRATGTDSGSPFDD